MPCRSVSPGFKLLFCTFFVACSVALHAREGFRGIGVTVSPRLGLSHNYSGDIGILPAKIGMGYDVLANYTYRPKAAGCTGELGMGLASFRQSVNPVPLYSHLGHNAVSYQFYYLQAVLKAGYAFDLGRSRLVTPMAAFRYLFYLPNSKASGTEWVYLDRRNFTSDLSYARWKRVFSTYPYSAYMLNLSVKFERPVSPDLVVSISPFLDYGFRTIQGTVHVSEMEYDFNTDDAYKVVTLNKGDAFGISFGVSYRL